jgi:hypothetical protein
MRTMRSSVSLVAGAIAVMLSSTQVSAQDANAVPLPSPAYPVTLRYGTGLVDIPVAWVSPNNGDIFLGFSGTDIPACGSPCDLSFSQKWNTNFTLETHWIQRFTIGFSLYSNNPEWGFYGQFLALTQKEGSLRPSIAVGFRNLGPYNHEDRLLIGHDVQIDSGGGTTGYTPPDYSKFKTSPTLYAVVSKDWKTGQTGTFGATIGYGNGIFSDDGGLGKNYNDKGQIVKGLFLGGRYAFRPSEDWMFNFMVENNGWDWNAGAVADWKGIFLGLYGTELEEGSMSPSKGSMYQVYNYTKFSLQLGFSTNLFLASKGAVLRSQVGELKQQENQLSAEIAQHEQKITELEAQLRKVAETSKRREALDSQIQEEKEAINRAEERLQQLQGAQKPAPAATPAPTPPPPPPPPPSAPTPPR